jgi:hypothetical protein
MSEYANKLAALDHLMAWRKHDARQIEILAAGPGRLYANHVDVTDEFLEGKRKNLAELDDLIVRAREELGLPILHQP